MITIPGAPTDYSVRTFHASGNGHLVAIWSGRHNGPTEVSESLDAGRTWRTLTGLGLGPYPIKLRVDDQTGSILAQSYYAGRLLSYMPVAAPADPAFNQVWQRQDDPVSKGIAQRSWTWGPAPFATQRELLQGVSGDSRLVQYYDKSRMEINDPKADRSAPWFISNGLLTVEMVAGRIQTGLNAWDPHPPALVPVAGDPDTGQNGAAPTYASFRGVASYEGGQHTVPSRVGSIVRESINSAGQVSTTIPITSSIRLAQYDAPAGHNIAEPFWNYLNRTGKVLENGQYVDRPIFSDWVFVMGHPISEPYWAQVGIQGRGTQWVLIQLFERRVLTYTPTNDPAWQVEMGNVGLHYYVWRYGDR
jgi:hypothetical protein